MATQTVTYQVPDRIIIAHNIKYGYTGTLPDGITPETRVAHFKRININRWRADTKEQEGNTLAATVIANNSSDIDTVVIT